jgi:hypothetical protein
VSKDAHFRRLRHPWSEPDEVSSMQTAKIRDSPESLVERCDLVDRSLALEGHEKCVVEVEDTAGSRYHGQNLRE